MRKAAIIAIMCLFAMVLTVSAREYKGIEMPEVIETENSVLLLNGIGERSIFSKSVYVAGLYLQAPEKNWREVVEIDASMAIRLHVTNAFFASSERIKNAFASGFRNNMPNRDIRPIKDKIEAFNAFFGGEISNDDVFLIKYIPGQGTRVIKNGELQGNVAGYEFKKAVFRIWLGETPAQESMKTGMLAAEVSDAALARKKEKSVQMAERKAALKAESEKRAAKAAAEQKKQMAEKKKARQARFKERFASEDIYFPLGEKQLTEQARRKLADKVKWLKMHPEVKTIIEGHTDRRGSTDNNLALAEKRARQVKAYMVAAGIAQERMEVVSYGEQRPAVEGDNPKAWSKNRRVHFRLVK